MQLTGRKRVVLWPPSCVCDMYLSGSSSHVTDIDDEGPAAATAFPRFARTRPHATEVGVLHARTHARVRACAPTYVGYMHPLHVCMCVCNFILPDQYWRPRSMLSGADGA